MLQLFRKAFAGPATRAENRTVPDLRRREAVLMAPLVALMFVVGIVPNLLLRPTDSSVDELLRRAEERRAVLIQNPGHLPSLAGSDTSRRNGGPPR